MTIRTAIVLGLCAHMSAAAVSDAQTYSLTIDPDASGLAATLGLDVDTAGTLVGDWNPDTNPEGTRTKPGLFGSFGATENLPVDAAFGFALDGDLDTRTSGTATIRLDLDAGSVVVDDMLADLLAGGAAAIPATLGVAPESFRTRQPDSTYIGIPLDIPIGELAITSLTLVQTEAAVGVLTQTGDGVYSFTVAGLADITGTAELLGSPIDIPPLPIPLVLAGEITITGDSLVLTSLQTIDQADEQTPDTQLPEFPLGLPTVLPPGNTANLLLNLVLERVATGLAGDLALTATGQLAACEGDFNSDGDVDTRDVIAFLNAWNAADQDADTNGDGTIDTRDVIAFLNLWTAGC